MTTWLDGKMNAHSPSAPSTPSRVIGTAFQPSVARTSRCAYTVQLVATSGQDGNVQLLSDSANPPTTVRAEARNASTGGGTIAEELTYDCPAGDYVKLVAAGNTTNTIIAQVEELIG